MPPTCEVRSRCLPADGCASMTCQLLLSCECRPPAPSFLPLRADTLPSWRAGLTEDGSAGGLRAAELGLREAVGGRGGVGLLLAGSALTPASGGAEGVGVRGGLMFWAAAASAAMQGSCMKGLAARTAPCLPAGCGFGGLWAPPRESSGIPVSTSELELLEDGF